MDIAIRLKSAEEKEKEKEKERKKRESDEEPPFRLVYTRGWEERKYRQRLVDLGRLEDQKQLKRKK